MSAEPGQPGDRRCPALSLAPIPPDDYVAALLGARVRLAREARGLTQAQLAEVLGLQHPWISKVERGLLQPNPGRLRALAVVLDVCPTYLLGF